MKAFPTIRDNNGIDIKVLEKSYPSIFSKKASPKVSDRYTFMSTADIVRASIEQGYIVVEAGQRSTRTSGRDPRFTRHFVRLRTATNKPIVGDVFPEVIVTNAHDGQARRTIAAGLFRLVCSNGMVVGAGPHNDSASRRHVGDAQEAVAEVERIMKSAVDSKKAIDSMMKTKLSPAKQTAFAKAAGDLAYEKLDFDPGLLLQVRRPEDEGDTVWKVMNRVQENIVKGGLILPAAGDRTRQATTRGITHIGRSFEFNSKLWALAEAAA